MKLMQDTEDKLTQWCADNLPPIVPLEKYNPPFEQLKEERNNGQCFVFNGGADFKNTLFSTHAMRYVYRAWHDSLHIASGNAFEYSNEMAVARLQQSEAIKLGINSRDAYLLRLDLELHIKHYYQHGKHPEYQTDMIAAYLNGEDDVADFSITSKH